jgi:hypothetical protein
MEAQRPSGQSVSGSGESESTLGDELRLARLEIVQFRTMTARLAAELEGLELDLANLKAQSSHDRSQLRSLRSSLSWRLTSPLRAIRRRSANAERKPGREI